MSHDNETLPCINLAVGSVKWTDPLYSIEDAGGCSQLADCDIRFRDHARFSTNGNIVAAAQSREDATSFCSALC